MMELSPIAHVDPGNPQRVHILDEHLTAVQGMAEKMAAQFGAEDWARLAGRWHDLGKFSEEFQKYIRANSGFEAELAAGAAGRVDHSTAGALHACEQLGAAGRILAYLIAGHHAGLPDWNGREQGNSCLEHRLQEGRKNGLLARAKRLSAEGALSGTSPQFDSTRFGGEDGLHLWIRILFSCLVDADYLDTENFMDEERSRNRGQYSPLSALSPRFNGFMENLGKRAQDDGEISVVNRIRAEVLDQCRKAAQGKPGFYTLTVPTGGGKTLSSLAFALEHAARNGQGRMIYAIPYTSIIEQTAEVFREVLGDAVLEHHSNLDATNETPHSKLAAENWDAPLIVTTNVQLFESLFAARTSRCRKLHNLVNSIVILDEAQLLPPGYLQPILDVMRLLVTHYGVTFVLCTATQPALGTRRDHHGRTLLKGIDDATEIVEDVSALDRQLERVRVIQPATLAVPGNWDDIAGEVARHPAVLAIVNTRRDCRELHRRMPPGTIHLSALMCGEHRSQMIREIKRRLRSGEPVRVVSTQLIEAGVDVDFPVVYRALAGLDSIAQAAGRCNREGKIEGKGELHVFVPPQPAPIGLLRYGEDTCRLLLQERPERLLTPALYTRYFEGYYSRMGDGGMDKEGILGLLTKDAREGKLQFRTAAERFAMIKNEGEVSILVPYANPDWPERDSRPLLAQLRAGKIYRDLLRNLQRYCVNVKRYEFLTLQKNGDLEEVQPDRWILRSETAYSPSLGLLVQEEENPAPAQLMV